MCCIGVMWTRAHIQSFEPVLLAFSSVCFLVCFYFLNAFDEWMYGRLYTLVCHLRVATCAKDIAKHSQSVSSID